MGDKLGTGVSTVICRITGGGHCSANDGGRNDGGGNVRDTASPSPSDTAPPGSEPSLADLQRDADQAQKNLDGASDGSDLVNRIIDLLKDFVGITDVQKCIGEGDIVSCLWAVFDVGSIFFAALKIGKFIKAIKEAVKIWRDLKDAKRAYEGFKAALTASKSRLERVAAKCGVPLYGASLVAGHARCAGLGRHRADRGRPGRRPRPRRVAGRRTPR